MAYQSFLQENVTPMKKNMELIDRYMRGIANEQEVERVERLLEKDEAFQKQFDRYLAFDLVFHISDYTEEEEQKDRRKRQRWRVTSALSIASVLVLVIWYFLSLPTLPTQAHKQTQISSQDTTKRRQVQDTTQTITSPVRQDSTPKTPPKQAIEIPTKNNQTPIDSVFLPLNPDMNQAAESSAEGGKGIKFKVLTPKKNQNFSATIVFEWENEGRTLPYTLTLFNRYGGTYKTFENIPAVQKNVRFEVDIRDFQPALYFWRLEHDTEEQPFIGKFFVKKQ